MKIKIQIFLLFFALSNIAFGQDPNCHYNVVLKQIHPEKYEYRIFLEDQNVEKYPFEYYTQDFPNYSHLIKSNDGKKIFLSQNFYTHCSSRQKNKLRVTIYRKNKKTNKIELMYADASVEEGQTEVIFKKFKSGKRKAKVNRFFSFVNRNNYEN